MRTGRRQSARRSQPILAEPDWLAIRIINSHPVLLRGGHVVTEVNAVQLLNTFHDGFSHVVGVHPDSFFAPGSAVWSHGEDRAFLPVGDPIDCQPECCGVGAWIWRQGERVHWQLIGDRWNRSLLSSHLMFDREEYLFTLEWARDRYRVRTAASFV